MKDNKYVLMVMNFVKKMFSDSPDVSIKRVIAFLMTCLVIEMVNAYIFLSKATPEYMFYGVAGLIPTILGIAVFGKYKTDKLQEQIKEDAAEELENKETK